MINVIDRNIKMQEKYILIWSSRTVFNNLSVNNKINFRKLEVNSKKLISTELHLKFNLTCLKENLLPTYTNIYILIYFLYIFLYICIYGNFNHTFCKRAANSIILQLLRFFKYNIRNF